LVTIPISVKVPTIGITVKIPTIGSFTETFMCIGNQYKGGEPALILVTSKKDINKNLTRWDTRNQDGGNALSYCNGLPRLDFYILMFLS
jgi:hypothetical protein